MTVSHEEAAALLGAWALDACSGEEAEDVMEHISGCPQCAAEAVRLRHAADQMAGAPRPSRRLRARALDRAFARREPAPAAPGYAAPYAAQVSVLDALLSELTPEEWVVKVLDAAGRPLHGPVACGEPARDGDWSVQDLVAHLTATDGLVAGQVGVTVDPPGTPAGPRDILARTATVMSRERARTPELTRAAWRRQTAALCAALRDDTSSRQSAVTLGRPMRIGSAMVGRAFETWVHTDDIATAVGRTLPPPLPRHLHPVADLGVRSLPHALQLRGAHIPDRPAPPARVVLTGPGGGDWLIPLSPRDPGATGAAPGGGPAGDGTGPGAGDLGAPVVTLEMDVLEFCFLAGGRRDPDRVPVRVTGDAALARELLAAAPAFSGP